MICSMVENGSLTFNYYRLYERKDEKMKIGTNMVRICNIVSLLLLVAILVCQFLPFWTVGDKQVSIQEYTWITWEQDDLTDSFEDTFGKDYMVKDLVLTPFAIVAGVILAAIFCLKNLKKSGAAFIPFIVGVIGIVGYLTVPILMMGQLWQLHLALCIAMTVISMIPLINCLTATINWFKVPKTA